jgi:hypothetical protein
MTSGTCLIIRPGNFGTQVQQSRFPKFVIDISSGVRHFFSCALRVRSLCGLCVCGCMRLCAALCGRVRPCAVRVRFFERQTHQPLDQPLDQPLLPLPLLYG